MRRLVLCGQSIYSLFIKTGLGLEFRPADLWAATTWRSPSPSSPDVISTADQQPPAQHCSCIFNKSLHNFFNLAMIGCSNYTMQFARYKTCTDVGACTTSDPCQWCSFFRDRRNTERKKKQTAERKYTSGAGIHTNSGAEIVIAEQKLT